MLQRFNTAMLIAQILRNAQMLQREMHKCTNAALFQYCNAQLHKGQLPKCTNARTYLLDAKRSGLASAPTPDSDPDLDLVGLAEELRGESIVGFVLLLGLNREQRETKQNETKERKKLH